MGVDGTGQIDGSPARIMQFGTSRFLLAHADYFIARSWAEGRGGGRIVVVQGSSRPAGQKKARAMAEQAAYPVVFRGRREGVDYDEKVMVDIFETALTATKDWVEIERRFVTDIDLVISNTGEEGYRVPEGDSPHAMPPQSFPLRLLRLLHARFSVGGKGVTILPCELLHANGHFLHDLVQGLAAEHYRDPTFKRWLSDQCRWADTLVDRIVSADLDPLGAVAEPYGLWAIARQPGLSLPFSHPDVRLVETLEPYEMRKLHLLNGPHSFLVEWRRIRGEEKSLRFVREAVEHREYRVPLEQMMFDEVVPVLAAKLPRKELEEYAATALERFENPYLNHALDDIAQHHIEKLKRRFLPVQQAGQALGIVTPRIDQVLLSAGVDGSWIDGMYSLW